MALIDFKVLPGIDKQDTTSGAENRWVDCDNTRFRYGLPEKVGGWSSLVTDTIVGVARRQFAFVIEQTAELLTVAIVQEANVVFKGVTSYN